MINSGKFPCFSSVWPDVVDRPTHAPTDVFTHHCNKLCLDYDDFCSLISYFSWEFYFYSFSLSLLHTSWQKSLSITDELALMAISHNFFKNDFLPFLSLQDCCMTFFHATLIQSNEWFLFDRPFVWSWLSSFKSNYTLIIMIVIGKKHQNFQCIWKSSKIDKRSCSSL